MRDQKNKPTSDKRKRGISRRKFLKGVGLGSGVLSSGILGGPLLPEASAVAQAAEVEVAGPTPAPIELTVNGQRKNLRLEPRVTLLEALRDWLDMTGAKKVCDRATCGACTVILDGQPVYSCSVLAIESQGKNIQTVESLAQGDSLHPLQAAFVENDAQQCGFCTPGFVVAAKAFLDKYPNPTREQARLGLGGNLCRCGTYAGIWKAVLEAATGRRDSQRGIGQGGGSNA
ncbi:MAG: twin-arginine translocation signal domain-containing protein [Acidobacteria bacterium]|nr:twin-arginine translocation signal domain-containing protein [Acidobacteriota bacterium]